MQTQYGLAYVREIFPDATIIVVSSPPAEQHGECVVREIRPFEHDGTMYRLDIYVSAFPVEPGTGGPIPVHVSLGKRIADLIAEDAKAAKP